MLVEERERLLALLLAAERRLLGLRESTNDRQRDCAMEEANLRLAIELLGQAIQGVDVREHGGAWHGRHDPTPAGPGVPRSRSPRAVASRRTRRTIGFMTGTPLNTAKPLSFSGATARAGSGRTSARRRSGLNDSVVVRPVRHAGAKERRLTGGQRICSTTAQRLARRRRSAKWLSAVSRSSHSERAARLPSSPADRTRPKRADPPAPVNRWPCGGFVAFRTLKPQ